MAKKKSKQIEKLQLELYSKDIFLNNILGIIDATRQEPDPYTPTQGLEIIENLAHLGLADGLAGPQREE